MNYPGRGTPRRLPAVAGAPRPDCGIRSRPKDHQAGTGARAPKRLPQGRRPLPVPGREIRPGGRSRKGRALARTGAKMLLLVMISSTLAIQAAVASGKSARCQGPPDFYTISQAAHGRQVFDANCSTCHGDKLQGDAGPPLAGRQFESYLQYSRISARQLFDFVTSQMPYNKPGSLSEEQYLSALAYIFYSDGYPGGRQALSKGRLHCLHLLPFPQSEVGTKAGQGGLSAPDSRESVAPPTNSAAASTSFRGTSPVDRAMRFRGSRGLRQENTR